ncbi:SagD family biosynthesis docking scaffold protein [Dictyobacter vulcani]|uniref:SagD family biosynthesis docking scaffold protein n=1 Tax=Dictyobacter vulcani TaxID=2607529 RepID=A0A5J4L245_9CHLR|nr:TOMM precursor leader peptide-binding protein [Dictyobacter vulcani]GER91516.1 SagD family biosynthesis docking scaffold protein [Dictyobacter vulcani]
MSKIHEHTIGLLGQGLIHQQLHDSLKHTYRIIPLTLESPEPYFTSCHLIVFCADSWSPQTLLQINTRCLETGVALLPLYTRFDKGIIGPLVVPGEAGCARCAEFRSLGAISTQVERELCQHAIFPSTNHTIVHAEDHATQPWLSPLSIGMLVVTGIEEIHAYLEKGTQKTQRALLTISLETLECTRHPFLPFSTCRDCGKLSDDSPELATISLQSCPKPDSSTYRTSQPKTSPRELMQTYLDQHTGLVQALSVNQQSVLQITSSYLQIATDNEHKDAHGTGSALSQQQSMVVSLLEAVERYAGLNARSKRAMIQASYQELIQQGHLVLDPTTLGLHSQEQYTYHQQQPSCHSLVAYHPGLRCNWIWGYSFQHQAPILVPEHCAYYGLPRTAENPAFIYEISNGCALGNCLEEAIFHGMMEVIERDTFLLTWYAQLSLPQLDLQSVTNPDIRIMIKRLEQHYGYSIRAFNASLDHALTCLCLLAVDEQQREDMPRAHVMAGCHPQPEQALLRGLRELTTALTVSPHNYQEKREQARQMLNDHTLVQQMMDHSLIYYLPEAFERLHFLYHSPQHTTFQDAFSPDKLQAYAHLDLRDDLQALIDNYLKRGTDTIVVDQTAPEHLPCGLRCVKVLMPGMLPMTFGHNNERVQLARLQQVPVALGYRSQPLTEAEINPHPHPFF